MTVDNMVDNVIRQYGHESVKSILFCELVDIAIENNMENKLEDIYKVIIGNYSFDEGLAILEGNALVQFAQR